MKSEHDRTARAELRTKLNDATRRLDKLLAIPPLTANDMCSECPTPANLHGWVMPAGAGPCPAWPRAAARVREVLMMLQRVAPTPEPQRLPEVKPLAVIQSGLPIAEVLARLAEIHATYPDAEVRRGKADRWEIWAVKGTEPTELA